MTAVEPSGEARLDVVMLLVEDDDADALIVEELLLDTGQHFAMLRARSVADAVEMVATDARVQCVLLDLGLPDSDGLSGLRAVLAASPATAVIVLTGLLDEHRGVEAVAAGAQDYLVKGVVDGELVVRSVRYALERKRNDEAALRLRESELRAEENARLERGLLPTPLLRDASLSFCATYRPGRSQALLGGDFYDVVEGSDGWVHVLMGDVMGHGPDEAALGVALRIAWRALTLAELAEPTRLAALQRVLVNERANEEVFATVATLAVAPDRRSGLLRLAGHPSPALLGAGPLPDDEVGPALGVVELLEEWPGRSVQLPETWSLLLLTDGLLEAHAGIGGERLGWDGVLAEAEPLLSSDWHAEDLLAGLLTAVETRNGGPLQDDVALLLLQHGS